MTVELLTSMNSIVDMVRFAVLAALTCHANTDKLEDTQPKELIQRIIKLGHESILEHINLTYSIKGLSRACLQELARHRHISLSVESTRHTLHKYVYETEERAYILDTVPSQLHGIIRDFFSFVDEADEDFSSDELKYYLPECWPTNLIMTCNVRALRHILKLRTASDALMEFRDLGIRLFLEVPDEFKYLLDDCVFKRGLKS